MKINVRHLSSRSFLFSFVVLSVLNEKSKRVLSQLSLFFLILFGVVVRELCHSIVCTSQVQKKMSACSIYGKKTNIFLEKKRLNIVTCVSLKTFIDHSQSLLWFFMPPGCLFYVQKHFTSWGHFGFHLCPFSFSHSLHHQHIRYCRCSILFFISKVNPRSTSKTTSQIAEVI